MVSSIAPKPTRSFLVGAGVGIAVASAAAALLVFCGERAGPNERALAVQNLGALPAAPAAAPAAAAAPSPPAAAALSAAEAGAGLPGAGLPGAGLPGAGLPAPAAALPAVEQQAGQSVSRKPAEPPESAASEAPDGGQAQRTPAARTGVSKAAAGDAFDLTDVGFKPKERIAR